jgi:hypothetical protein
MISKQLRPLAAVAVAAAPIAVADFTHKPCHLDPPPPQAPLLTKVGCASSPAQVWVTKSSSHLHPLTPHPPSIPQHPCPYFTPPPPPSGSLLTPHSPRLGVLILLHQCQVCKRTLTVSDTHTTTHTPYSPPHPPPSPPQLPPAPQVPPPGPPQSKAGCTTPPAAVSAM